MNFKKSTSLDNLDDQLSAFLQQHAARDLLWGILDHFFTVSISSENPSKKFWPARICEVAGRPNMGVSWAASVSGGSHPGFTSLLINTEWSSNIAMFSENLITHCKKQQNNLSRKFTKVLSVEHFSPNLSIGKPTNQVKACRQSNQIWSFVLRTCQLWSALVLFSPQSKEVRLVALSSI